VNRYEQIYRQASVLLLTCDNEWSKIGALSLMVKTNNLMFQTALYPEIMKMNEHNLDKNTLGLKGRQIKQMTKEILQALS
jgi:hypothetical protein